MAGEYRIIRALTSLAVGLARLGYQEESHSISKMLEELLRNAPDPNDAAFLANLTGLQGDVKSSDMGQGFALEPAFSDTSPVD